MADITLILVLVASQVMLFPSRSLCAPVPRVHPAPQRLSPNSSQRASLSPDRLLPSTSPPLSPNAGPASYSHQPTSSRLRAKFQGRRSYSEVGSLHYLHRRLLPFLLPFACPALISGIRPLSCPESSSSPDEGSCVHPPEAQVPAGGDARLWPNQSTAPDLFSGFGQASFSSWSWRRDRRRQRGRERRGQQSEQQPPSLSSGPGFPAGCRGDETDSHKNHHFHNIKLDGVLKD